MLARSPDERFATPQEVADALTPFTRGADLVRLLDVAQAAPSVTAESLPPTRWPASPREATATNSASSVTTSPTVATESPSAAARSAAGEALGEAGVAGRRRNGWRLLGAVTAAAVLLTLLVVVVRNRATQPTAPAVPDDGSADVRAGGAPDDDGGARRAALAVLKVGGRVEVQPPGSELRWVEHIEDLPPAPFRITWIEVHRDRAEPITTDWLRDVLAGAPLLDGIALHEQRLGDAAMPLLAASGSLAHAMLSDVGITDAGLAQLAELSLEQLNAGKNPIGDDGIRALGTPANLRLLVLTDTDVTDEAMRHIARWPRLRSLTLGSTDVSDRGLAHLEKLTSLQEIDLDETLVTPAGVARFRQALPDCRVVHAASNLH
jgi:hypothetical protein